MSASRPPSQPYMAERWYQLLSEACRRENQRLVATRLGINPSTVGQVLHGSGLYGTGQASTARVATRVLHTFGSYECPHLTARFEEPRHVTAEECRAYAHRPVPAGSPGDLEHWRACNACEHKPLSAPPVVRPPVPRRRRNAEGAALTTTTTSPQEQTAP